MSEKECKSLWIRCPICGNKTRTKVYHDTVLVNFPLYCYEYEMIKSTWIGQRIQILADLSDSLKKKKIESELDLNGLLF